MDKQQATTFIQDKLEQGVPPAEISRELAQALKAPPEMVDRFIAQVQKQFEAAHPPPQPAPPAEPPPPAAPAEPVLPPWLQETPPAQAMYNAPTVISARPTLPTEAAPNSAAITNLQQAAEFVIAGLEQNRTQPDIAAELALLTGEPLAQVQKFVALTAARQARQKPAVHPDLARKPSGLEALETPEVTQYVLRQLRKQKKRSDIVMTLCEKAGVEWSQAQRFVGQVEAEHHSQIRASQQVWVIPLGVLFILGGLALAVLSGLSILYFVDYRFTPVLRISPEGAFGLFLTGFLLIAGGVAGVVLAIRSQLD